MIADGSIRIERHDNEERTEIATIGQGDVFGEMSLVTENPRAATAVTAGAVTAWKIPKEAVHRHMEESPDLKAAIQRFLSRW
mgnify:CR=1 FL=1